MNRFALFAVLGGVILLCSSTLSADSQKGPFYYLSPLPGAKLVSNQTTIIFRPASEFSAQRGDWTNAVTVTGTESGSHSGDWVVARDGKTVIFKPHRQFTAGEKVRVTVIGQMDELRGREDFDFVFTISPKTTELQMEELPPLCDCLGIEQSLSGQLGKEQSLKRSSRVVDDFSCTYELPQDFPEITITTKDNPTPGHIFLANFPYGGSSGARYMMILKNTGVPVYFQKVGRMVL
ncbi:MAG: hypothetical protein KAJ37_01465, partial [Candidatus Krumholzibacteria bacterium]|nr:hypothetical protein [Candidatus Krumholzibacteria bacterium]